MTSSIAVMMATPRGTWPSAAGGIIVAVLISVACHTGTAAQVPSATAAVPARVANLHAFARIYGVVRWFHPSDAAATIDWNRFAVEGARRVIDDGSRCLSIRANNVRVSAAMFKTAKG